MERNADADTTDAANPAAANDDGDDEVGIAVNNLKPGISFDHLVEVAADYVQCWPCGFMMGRNRRWDFPFWRSIPRVLT